MEDQDTSPLETVFPQEIFEKIFDEVPSCNGLLSLSLVCHAFLDLARSRLFREVTVYMDRNTPSGRQRSYEALLNTLNQNPDITRHIRRLRCLSQGSAVFKPVPFNKIFSLPHLSHLTLSGQSSNIMYIPRATSVVHHTGTARLLEHYISTGNLSSLTLCHLKNVPIILILLSSTLTSLNFDTCTFSVGKLSNFTIPSSRLKTMKCTESVDWFETCTSIAAVNGQALPTAKELNLSFTRTVNTNRYINPLFQHVPSLESLSVEAKRLIMVDSLDLPGCMRTASSSLKEISISWKCLYENDDDIIKLLCNALQGVLTNNVLERVKLKVEVKAEGLPLPSTYFLPWIRLDELLMKDLHVRFPCLREVNICFVLTTPTARLHVAGEDGTEAPAFLRTRLRRLLAVDADTHGGLKCNVTVHAGDYCYHSCASTPLQV